MSDIVLVTGAPCSGKTSIARPLANRLGLPVVSRDALKEMLFDELGWNDADRSRKLGMLSYRLLNDSVRLLVESAGSGIVESNFSIAGLAKLAEILDGSGSRTFSIYVRAPAEVLRTRFIERAAGLNGRHAGHVDQTRVDEMETQFRANLIEAISGLPGQYMVVDSSRSSVQEIVDEVLTGFRAAQAM
jgi:predicted kinase